MKLIKIAEAQDMVGMVLPRVEGVLTALYDQKTGEKDGKPWAMQNGMIKDETGEMKIVFSGHEPISLLMKGQRIQIESFTSKQHGLVGIKVKSNTWKEKTTIEIWATGTAKILFPDVQDAPDAEKPLMVEDRRDKAPKPLTTAVYIDPEHKAAERVAQFRLMYEICYKEAVAFSIKTELEELEDRRQIATAFFIQAVREGLDRGLTIKHEEEEIPY